MLKLKTNTSILRTLGLPRKGFRPILVANNRSLSSNRILHQEASKSGKKQEGDVFNPRFMGVATDIFVPTSYRNLPSVFTSPIIVTKSLIRRLYTFGFNTFKIAIFRFQTGSKPNFLLWKNKAIETYIQVNKSFAEKDLRKIHSNVSIWVEEALGARIRKLPDNLSLEWRIKKFNNVPKLVHIEPIMIPGQPLEHIQLVYKFDTKQELIKLNKITKKVEKQDNDIVDFVVFLCNSITNELILSGSVFESKPGAKLPKNSTDQEKKHIVNKMRTCGDIFRLPSSN